MTASEVRQNFGQFLDYGIQEPVVVKRQKRELGVFLPMGLYRRMLARQNSRILAEVDIVQVAAGGLSESVLDELKPLVEAEVPDSDPALEFGLHGEDLSPMSNEEIDRAVYG